jgi:hypothetical protein
MERHFIITGAGHSTESQALSEIDAEKLKLEVGRALQYFKQQVRNENIDRIFLFGATRHANEIKMLLESSFRISVVPIVREGKRFFASDASEEGKENLPLFNVVHVAALYSDFQRYIDFLPHELHHEKYVRYRQFALASFAVAGYLFMGGAAFLLNREASRISQCIQPAPPSSVLEQTSLSDQQVQQDRTFALASNKSDAWLRERHYLLAELVRELAVASPPQIQITGLEVTGKGDGWQVKLNAEIRSSNGSQSQQLLLKFQEDISGLPCLKQLTWENVRLEDTESSADLVNSKNSRNNLLTFTMRGALNQKILAGKPKPSYSKNSSGI